VTEPGSIVGEPIDRLRSTDPKGAVVFFATPAYAGIHPLYVRSLLDATRELCAAGYRVQHAFTIHQALIQNAREELFGHFLASGAEWLVMPDGDIGFEKDLPLRMIQFMSADVAVRGLCAAPAPGRKLYIERAIEKGLQEAIGFNISPSNHDALRALHENAHEERFQSRDAPDRFIRVPLCSTTFFMMHKSAAQKMAYFYKRDLEVNIAGTPSVAVFHPIIEDKLHYGEDLSFFLRWVRMRYAPIWAITTATLSHSGPITLTGQLHRTLFQPHHTETVSRSWPYEETQIKGDMP
jgi:hypothetical protein